METDLVTEWLSTLYHGDGVLHCCSIASTSFCNTVLHTLGAVVGFCNTVLHTLGAVVSITAGKTMLKPEYDWHPQGCKPADSPSMAAKCIQASKVSGILPTNRNQMAQP